MALEDGVEVAEDGGAIGTGNDARVAMLESINDANDALRADELSSVNDDGSTEAFVVQNADGSQEALPDDIAKDPEADAEIARLAEETGEPAPAEQMITRKINGRDVTLPLNEWLDRASKIEAADAYLAEAARLRTEQQRAVEAKAAPAPQDTVDDDLALARAIQMGDEAEAVAAIRKIRAAPPSFSQDDIARTIDDRLAFNGANKWFRDNYSDIAGDPILYGLAKETDAKLLAAGDKRSYEERYKDIGDTLNKWIGDQVKQRAPAPQGQEKLARKAAATPPPRSAASKTASSVEEEPEETASSVIAKIAQSRGGPQWMQGVTRH